MILLGLILGTARLEGIFIVCPPLSNMPLLILSPLDVTVIVLPGQGVDGKNRKNEWLGRSFNSIVVPARTYVVLMSYANC